MNKSSAKYQQLASCLIIRTLRFLYPKTAVPLLLAVGLLGACKPDEISITHTGSVPVSKEVMGVILAGCDIFFEVDNANSEKIDHLGFEITIADPEASEERLYDMHTGKWSGGPFDTDKLRYRNLPSGISKVAARMSKGACDTSFVVKIFNVSCRMGEDDCAESVTISQ